MFVIQIILLLLLSAVSVAVLVALFRVLRGAAKRRLLAEMRGVLCDAPDSVGISVMYSGVDDMKLVENLLDVGYLRYEVVLVVDSGHREALFASLISDYFLIRVNHELSCELPVKGVRGFYRSRKRCFRRLVVIDKAFTSAADDLDAAVGVVTYDYVLPMREGWWLMSGAIGRLAAELSEFPAGTVDLVRSLMSVPAMLLRREVVVAAGGFAHNPWRAVPCCRRKMVREPLIRTMHPPLHAGWRWSLVWTVLLVAGAVVTAVQGWWELCAVLLTVAVVWGAVRVAAPFVTKGTGYAVNGPAVFDFLLRKFSVKRFTIS